MANEIEETLNSQIFLLFEKVEKMYTPEGYMCLFVVVVVFS